MATIQLSNAPFIQKNFIVSQVFSEEHHALDLAPYGFQGELYAIDDFEVITSVVMHNSYGNYFIARNNNNTMYLYAHMSTYPPTIGTTFQIHEYVGDAGTTGHSTGVHLHLEMQIGNTWDYQAPFSSYINPCDYLTGIINVVDSSNVYYYDGTPTPTPTITDKKHKFPWFIYQNNK